MKNLGYDQDYDLVRDLSDKFESLTSTAMGYSISGASTNTTTALLVLKILLKQQIILQRSTTVPYSMMTSFT